MMTIEEYTKKKQDQWIKSHEWLKLLKVGDLVIVDYKIRHVERIAPNHLLVYGDKYRKVDGSLVCDKDQQISYLLEATKERIEDAKFRKNLIDLIDYLNRTSVDTIKKKCSLEKLEVAINLIKFGE